MEKERDEHIRDAGNAEKLQEKYLEHKELDPNVTLSEVDCSDASSYDAGYSSGFERMVGDKQMKFLREKAKNWKEAHLVVRQAQEEKVRRKKLE